MPQDQQNVYTDDDLDPEFYRRFYRDFSNLGDQELSDHWQSYGKEEGRFPNLARFLTDRAAKNIILPPDFSVSTYKFLNQDLAGSYRYDWELVVHYIESGVAENRAYRIEGADFEDLCKEFLSQNEEQENQISLNSRNARYVNLTDMLAKNEIFSDRFLNSFDVNDYKTLVTTEKLRSRIQCIRHFCETGLLSMIPINVDSYFDPDFYCERYGFRLESKPEELYRDWINYGIESERLPNARAQLKALGFTNLTEFPTAFIPKVYNRWNPDLSDTITSKWHALTHFVEHGVLEQRKGCELSVETADIYQIAADKVSISPNPENALPIYERILLTDPHHTLTLRHYADCLLRTGRYYSASEVYSKTIALGKESIWTRINLATCYEKLGKWDAAIKVLQRLHQRTPGDLALSRRVREAQRLAFEGSAGEAAWLSENKFYDQAIKKMSLAELFLTEDLVSLPESPKYAEPNAVTTTIAIVADVGLHQCEFYRVDQKLEHIRRAGYTGLKFNYQTDLSNFKNSLDLINAAIFYRVPGTPEVIEAIQLARLAGIPTIYEIDDLMFDSRYFPDSFESYGGQISNEMYAGLVIGTESLSAAMSLCDYAISSTPTLVELMRSKVRRQRAFLHRNAFSELHEIAQKRANFEKLKSEKVTYLFYGTGTKAHNSDFDEDCAPALARLLQEFSNQLHLIIVGYMTIPQILIPYMDHITIIKPIWNLLSYWKLLASVDINIAVLKPSLMADCKSEIKWLEAAMFKIPTAMTATATHKDVALGGLGAALITQPAEWYPVLKSLIEDPIKRAAISEVAQAHAKSEYSIDRMAENIRQIFSDILGPRPVRSRHRILIVNVFFPPQSIGGATRVVRDNVKYLHEKCHETFEVEVFATVEGGLIPYQIGRYIWEGIPVTTVTTPEDANIDRKISDQKMGEIFARVLDRFQPALVHLHCIQRITSEICEVMRERDIPYVVTVHDAWWISDKQFLVDEIGEYEIYDYTTPLNVLKLRGSESFDRMQTLLSFLSSARRVLAVSLEFASIYERCGFTNVQVIENGVTQFDVGPCLSRRPGPLLRLGYLGGLSIHKGYNLIRAALFTSDFAGLELVVIDHSITPGVEHKAKWGGTVVTFRAKEPQEDVAFLYAQLDVLLAPSVWPESYGLVVREAIRAGCWIVASNRGAIGSDVSAAVGQVISVDTFEELRDVLGQMNQEPDKFRGRPPRSGHQRSADDQGIQLKELYRILLGDRADAESTT